MTHSLKPITIGIIDSGAPASHVAQSRRFALSPNGVRQAEGLNDRLGHGTLVHQVLAENVPQATLIHAQVFQERPVTSAAQVSHALLWLTAQKVDLICLSLGLAKDRDILREACKEAYRSGVVLIAATPAQGTAAYPAAYPEVIAATGDARCLHDQISILDHNGLTVFGSWCASPEQTGGGAGGASIGCARLAAHIGQILSAHPDLSQPEIESRLCAVAFYQGRERKRDDHAD